MRIVACAALLIGSAAVAGIAVSSSAGGVGGYVSETGVPGHPYAQLYRQSVLGIAVTAAAVAGLLWSRCRWAALALLAAAPAVAVSGAVSCTDGCPLPPYAATTARDLGHAAASVIGVGCCALAMLAAAWLASGWLRHASRIAVAAGWPLLIATAAGILAVGRGTFTGLTERLGLAVCVGWLLAVAAGTLARPGP